MKTIRFAIFAVLLCGVDGLKPSLQGQTSRLQSQLHLSQNSFKQHEGYMKPLEDMEATVMRMVDYLGAMWVQPLKDQASFFQGYRIVGHAPSEVASSSSARHQHRKVNAIPKVMSANPSSTPCKAAPPKRVVFSLTTTAPRLDRIKPALDSVISEQSRPPDAVYLSVGPEVKELPLWLQKDMQEGPGHGVLKVLRYPKDLGPGMKLLGGLREELAAGHNDSLVVYGDDDQLYGSDLLELHIERHRCASGEHRKAFGGRAIQAGKPSISILEATGGISIYAGHVPEEAFKIGDSPDQCKFSDDYFFSRAFHKAGVQLEVMSECEMNWNTGKMSPRCLRGGLPDVASTNALSRLSLGQHKKSFTGDWVSQLHRYEDCGRALGE